MVNHLNRLIPLLFIFGFIAYTLIAVQNKPRVLVLHSYHIGYSWTDRVNIGIAQVLKDEAFSVRYHYMDTKRHSGSGFKSRAGTRAQKLIDSWEPHVIIAVDDNAQKYVTKHYLNHPKINVVFSGVNAKPEAYGFDQADNVTGILERRPLPIVKESILKIFFPDSINIADSNPVDVVFITDNSTTSKLNIELIKQYTWAPEINLDIIKVCSYKQWQEAVLLANQQSDLILLNGYKTLVPAKDAEGKDPCNSKGKDRVAVKEVIKWTQENTANVPVLGFSSSYVNDGGQIAFSASPVEQGHVASEMAIQIIHGKRPSELPIESAKQFTFYMRESLFERYPDIEIPFVYKALARATGNYYESDKK
ncbi:MULTISPECIES: ABC transporter substrate-binding protein [Pseudoalteromonas]|uniref:ABC-type uncharacterized transport system, periplasmic component n=1 Tax=Pseudoalteromonas luteoviolacea (strain 2ta16) TaxID=1353533 RepID=V4JBX1_PSEL2|nr:MULTISPECIES: ABC transporter substrate binding protein [Pseudoalteromonas]ESP92632.1 ABC-type uncharacterized transport system, periplasmic component [Pseudoalteromonas luteoviolacea 2ta16]KZN35440.1 hypothetical protein N483_00380 [Pseudoalteromonas luteoviolacea NCIMB 1944]MCG7546586.1 hypothetical protein [Pseudoalteromonas sp. Of7M-16]